MLMISCGLRYEGTGYVPCCVGRSWHLPKRLSVVALLILPSLLPIFSIFSRVLHCSIYIWNEIATLLSQVLEYTIKYCFPPVMSNPIPILVCARQARIVQPVTEGMSPEYEGVYYLFPSSFAPFTRVPSHTLEFALLVPYLPPHDTS